MSDFQQTINYNQALGVVGEVAFSGPQRVTPYNLVSTPNANVIGNAFTVTNGGIPDNGALAPNAGTAAVGFAGGIFAGILMSPKEYASFGGSTGPLSSTITLPDNKVGYLMTMGFLFASLSTANNAVGNRVYADNTTGVLGSQAPSIAGTATQATTVLTVVTSTGAPIGVGSTVNIAGAAPVIVESLGTGTGGTGTYNVDFSQTVSSAAAISGNGVAPTGKSFVPGCTVAKYDSVAAAAAAGSCNAVIQLTN